MFSRRIITFAGWVPAVIIPVATVQQLIHVLTADSVEGNSPLTWFLFGIANICLYIYQEKYRQLQAIIGLLGTALLDFLIVASIFIRS